ncbi:uncharacterized protein LOC101901361 [Musca domestica]|uniref:Uncharacterized protein LOC101901361 n=1 Tax=Musca domestica TaxID=7370 RepID=A0A9J7CT61_MUSDO|nr:uncharacterized protein LOC101901361 [Musca domestica]
MKVLIVLFAIAVAIQASQASPPNRAKRSDQFVQRFEKMGSLAKNLIPRTEVVILNTIQKIPKTNSYNKYRQDLQSYVNYLNQYKTKRGKCYEKSFDLIGKYAETMERYDKPNATEEARRVRSLLKECGSETLTRDLDEWIDAYEKSNFDVESQKLTSEDTRKIMTLLQEVC